MVLRPGGGVNDDARRPAPSPARAGLGIMSGAGRSGARLSTEVGKSRAAINGCPQNALTQAERYSKGVADSPFHFRGYRVPFLCSTTGEVLWFHDARHKLNQSRRVVGLLHSNSTLREAKRGWKGKSKKPCAARDSWAQ